MNFTKLLTFCEEKRQGRKARASSDKTQTRQPQSLRTPNEP